MDSIISLIFLVIIVNDVTSMTTTDHVSKVLSEEGYKNEIHTVTTADKYILRLHRVPPAGSRILRPVLIVHGMASSSFQYVITGPGVPQAITFKLADHGYDVWLINCRCTDFTQHQDISPSSPQYWKFSFHEIATYDLPAVIDYVLMTTNQTFVHYIGHSQGTTAVIAMLSLHPRYNKKLKTLHLMAPAVYFANAAITLKTLALFTGLLENAFAALGIHKTPTVIEDLAVIGGYLCSSKSVMTMEICKLIFYATAGPSSHFNQALTVDSTITHIFRYILNSISLMQLLHFSQLIQADEFVQYDHKRETNLLFYNQTTPLQYKLSNVKTKIHFIYGTSDSLSNYRDVERLINELRTRIIGVDRIDGYNHFDFFIAKDTNELVNTKILNLMNRYSH